MANPISWSIPKITINELCFYHPQMIGLLVVGSHYPIFRHTKKATYHPTAVARAGSIFLAELSKQIINLLALHNSPRSSRAANWTCKKVRFMVRFNQQQIGSFTINGNIIKKITCFHWILGTGLIKGSSSFQFFPTTLQLWNVCVVGCTGDLTGLLYNHPPSHF